MHFSTIISVLCLATFVAALPRSHRYILEEISTDDDYKPSTSTHSHIFRLDDEEPYTCRIHVNVFDKPKAETETAKCCAAAGGNGNMVCTRSLPPICFCAPLANEDKAEEFKKCAREYSIGNSEIACSH